MNTSSTANSSLSSPPRALSAGIRRRAWSDPIARFFWLMSVVLLLMAIVFAVRGFGTWRRESALIGTGIPVDARIYAITSAQGTIMRSGFSADPSNPVTLQFSWNSQMYQTHEAHVLEGYDRLATVGDIVRVRVDPQDPENWTSLASPMPLHDRIMGSLLTLPALLAAFAVATLRRKQLACLWEHGIVTPSLVVSSSVSALSPLGKAVRCTPATEGDARVFNVYLPGRRTPPEPGEMIDLLAKAAPSARAVAAEFFA
jgi:hypothetical protein